MKKQTIRIYLSGLLVVAGVMTSVAQSSTLPLPFGEALQLMKANHPALKQSAHYIREKEAEKAIRRGLYLPQVSMSATAVSMSDPLHLDLTPVRDAILPLYNTLGNYGVFSGVPNPDPATHAVLPVLPDNLSTAAVRQQLLQGAEKVAQGEWDQMIQEKTFAMVNAGVNMPLYSGGKIAGANKVAALEIEMSKEELRNVEGELLTELVTRYYGLSLGQQAREVRQQMARAMSKHQQDAQKFFSEGMMARVEWLNAAVAQADAERELKQAQRNLDILQQALSATLALEQPDSIVPLTPLFINKQMPDAGYFIQKALECNPKLNQLEGKSQLVDLKHTVSKGEYLPSAALFGTYTLADYQKSVYLPDWTVGVGLKWTLFEGFSRNNEMKKTQEMKAQVDEAREKAHQDIATYIFKLRQELSMQLEQIADLDQTLELATEYCTSTEKAFAQGMSTSTAVVDAHTKIAQVKLMRLKLFYDYDSTLAKLLQTAGIPEQFPDYCAGENTIIESLN
jgi:outer membrane protein TolC